MKFFVLCGFFVVAMAQRHNHQQQQHQQQAQQYNNNNNINNNNNNIKESNNKYKDIPIVSLQQNLEYDGRFNYAYETGDGTKVEQSGALKASSFDPKSAGEAVEGSYSYVGDDGQTYSISYRADENGYQAFGANLPTPPPIPPEIAKAVEYLKSLPPHKDNQ